MSKASRKIAQNRPALRRSAERLSQDTIAGQTSVQEFAQVLRHRIGSLVSGIEGYTELLMTSLSDPEDRESGIRILEGVRRIEAVLEDLDLYHASPHVVLRSVVITDVLFQLQRILPDTDASRVQFDAQIPDGQRVMADPKALRQAVMALITNALEATHHEGSIVIISVGVEPCPTQGHPIIQIRVHNDGTLSQNTSPDLVFEPFHTTKAWNLGVGLPLAEQIARLHKGTLVLEESSEAHGTTFTLTLPVQED